VFFLGFFYFSNCDLFGNLSAINFAFCSNIVSSLLPESFMQNIGAPSKALRAAWVLEHTTGDLRIHGMKTVL
jgi:hypothetical protein